MSKGQYLAHRDGKGRFLLQSTDTGIIQGWLFPAMPGESARAFSYDYGSVWYPDQIINLNNFSELAEIPFFTIESFYLDDYFKRTECQSIWPILGVSAKYGGYNFRQNTIETNPKNIIWQYQVTNPNGSWFVPILSLWVNDQGCWLSNRDGLILAINHQGEMIQKHSLSKLTRCLTGLEDTAYVSCDDGKIYELTGKLPTPIYSVRPPTNYDYTYQILVLNQTKQSLLIADICGQVMLLNNDLEVQWQQKNTDYWQTWFLDSDEETVYQGHYLGITAYDINTGQIKWTQPFTAPILCGIVTGKEVIVACSDRSIYNLEKPDNSKTGEIIVKQIYTCSGMPYTMSYSIDQQSLIIGDYTGKIDILDIKGNLQKSIQLSGGAIMDLSLWENRLYVVTSQGNLICLELISIFHL